MDSSDSKRLIELGHRVTDGTPVDWDAEILDGSPLLASMLASLQQLEALGQAYRSLDSTQAMRRGHSGAAAGVNPPETCLFRWGHLEALELVGRGSFGEVYRAFDTQLHREVALKLRRVRSRQAAKTTARRFLAEARDLALVRHPNVIVVHGADTYDDRIGFWTEFIHGETLAARLASQGTMSAKEATLVGLDLSRALAAVHGAGLVHGDVKAANVMRESRGRIVLMDFGAASLRGGGRTVGRIRGTPLTMAPEVLDGESPRPAADLYSLGVLLYQLASGRLPFVTESLTELQDMHEEGRRPLLAELRPDLPPAFVAVVERALHIDPGLRCQSAAEMESALHTALGSPEVKRHSLPAEAEPIIGREGELAELKQRFARGARLLTLLGAGGMGKTRLAVHFGWRELEAWPGGVWFCDLTEARSLDGIASAVASALDVPLGKDDPIEQLGHVIAARRRCLVMLDNFEQVSEYAGQSVERWLERAAEARFLVTSRNRLDVYGEEVQPVEPLAQESGVELFIARARRLEREFAPVGSEAEAVHAVVRLTEGMPLAIELAAVRVRVMSVSEIVERMGERFRLLAGSGRGRHASLKAAIDGSWELLEDWEKAAWAQCSVFEGGFTLEAAEGVLDLTFWADGPWIVDVVQSLVDKNLLRTWTSPSTGGTTMPATRFGMYVSLQEYAREKLGQEEAISRGGSSAHAESAAEERHGRWYERYGSEKTLAAIDQREGASTRAQLHLELENLVAACRRALARGDGKTVMATYRAAWAVLEIRGPYGVAVQLGRELLGAPLAPEDRANVLLTLANAEWRSGYLEEASAHFDAGLTIAREVRNRRLEAVIVAGLGIIDYQRGRMDEARTRYEAALTIERELGNRQYEGVLLGWLASLHSLQGRMDEARAGYEAALAIHRELGNRRLEGTITANLGLVHNYQGRIEEARAHYESALAIHREVGNRHAEGFALGSMASLLALEGRSAEALADYEAALAIARELGNRRSEGYVLGNLGRLLHEQGRIDEAREHIQESLAIARELGDRRAEGYFLGGLASLDAEQGRMKEAMDAVRQGEALLREVGDSLALAMLLCDRAGIERRNGDLPAARATLGKAKTLAAELGADLGSELGQEISKIDQVLSQES